MNSPDTFRAGDSVSWSESLADYPAGAGWVLKYRLIWSSGTPKDFEATASGDDHAVALSAATTATYAAGSATLVAWVEKSGEKITLDSKLVTILPDLTTATTFDGRSKNRRALDDAEAALQSYLAGGRGMVQEYAIGDRQYKFRNLAEIRDLIAELRTAVARENAVLGALNGTPANNKIYYRAGSPR